MDSYNPINVPVPDSGSDDEYAKESQREDNVQPLPKFTQPDLDGLHQDAECPICLKLLCEPTTLACGHSFCRLCLSNSESRQFSVACALCRTHRSGPFPAPNVVLRAMLQRLFPEEYASRLEEVNAEDQSVQDSSGLFRVNDVLPESSEMGQDDTALDSGMTVQEMRMLMEEEGLPLMVYNRQLASEPKRLMLGANGATCFLVDCFLVDNDWDWRNEDSAPVDPVASFNLCELECMQLGGRCQFARYVQTQSAGHPLPSQLLDAPRPEDSFDRLASLKFRDGTLCLRLLSPTLRTAAINVIREIKPDCPVEA